MHLFGDSSGPHLTHFQARRDGNRVELGWDVRNAPALRWRVLRSEQDFATSSDALPGSGQTVASPAALDALLGRYQPGDIVQITWDDPTGTRHTSTVQLAAGPAA